jgi:uncharacterized protein
MRATNNRRFLILHGVENRRPVEHWQHWLAEQLRQRHEVVLYPQLPEPEHPRLEAWIELIRAELAQLGDGERTVLCHSLAVLAWFHLASQLSESERVQRVLLVSPPSADILWPEIAHFAPSGDLSPEVIRAAADETRIVHRDDDPFCPSGADRLYADPLGIPAYRVAGRGHLTIDDGYGPWPRVLAWCLDNTTPLGA